ncbi:MAG: hypothetical protein HY896_00860 [Deltaproteobacteria bacterium]|nr:hypothetical protein [Deltaproteobacteria bacterium]
MKVPEGWYFHPMLVHFPQALFPAAAASFVLYLATGIVNFERGAHLMTSFGMAATPFTMISGYLDWKIRYKGYMTSVFKIKIVTGFVLFGLSLCAVLLRTLVPGIDQLPLSGLGWLRGGLLFGCVAGCIVEGHYGGKLVFH